MNLLSCLSPLRRAAPAAPSAERRSPVESESATEPRDWGCGWFDSSLELHRGLQVREHASADTLGRDLPLESWLELHLASWQPAAGQAC